MNATPFMMGITEEETGQRIDNFLVTRLKGVPKSRIYKAIRTGEVRVNKKRIKAEYRLHAGDQIRIPPLRMSTAHPEVHAQQTEVPKMMAQQLEQSVIFEDSHILLINKPAGWAAHGGSGIRLGIIEGFRLLRPKTKYLELVHRLDRETTGCLLLAKKPSILKTLHASFVQKRVRKTYLALVYGRLKKAEYLVDQPLLKNTLSSGERVVRIHTAGKPAQTRFKRIKQFERFALVQVFPLTGRTHQIRVHSAYLGHPILGDQKYADHRLLPKAKHLMLHSAALEFELLDQSFGFCACLSQSFLSYMKHA